MKLCPQNIHVALQPIPECLQQHSARDWNDNADVHLYKVNQPEIFTVFSRFFSSKIRVCLSWYRFQRLSSTKPISRPRGVRRLSALSALSSRRCSERLKKTISCYRSFSKTTKVPMLFYHFHIDANTHSSRCMFATDKLLKEIEIQLGKT